MYQPFAKSTISRNHKMLIYERMNSLRPSVNQLLVTENRGKASKVLDRCLKARPGSREGLADYCIVCVQFKYVFYSA